MNSTENLLGKFDMEEDMLEKCARNDGNQQIWKQIVVVTVNVVKKFPVILVASYNWVFTPVDESFILQTCYNLF